MVRLLLVGSVGMLGALAFGASMHASGKGRSPGGRPDGGRPGFISVAALYRTYGGGTCGTPSPLDGITVHVRARVDWGNVFDKASYPQLPYEKFRIYDEQDGASVDVWAVAPDNRAVFDLLRRHAGSAKHAVLVTGTLVTFDMPVMGDCRKGLKIQLRETNGIHFE